MAKSNVPYLAIGLTTLGAAAVGAAIGYVVSKPKTVASGYAGSSLGSSSPPGLLPSGYAYPPSAIPAAGFAYAQGALPAGALASSAFLPAGDVASTSETLPAGNPFEVTRIDTTYLQPSVATGANMSGFSPIASNAADPSIARPGSSITQGRVNPALVPKFGIGAQKKKPSGCGCSG